MTFTDAVTLHAPKKHGNCLGAPEKVQKRSGSPKKGQKRWEPPKLPKMANPTLRAMSLTSPLLSPLLNPPEKRDPRFTDGDTLHASYSYRKSSETVSERPKKFRNGLGLAQKSSEMVRQPHKRPKVANPRFTDGGTLHAMSLTSPLLSPLLNPPEKRDPRFTDGGTLHASYS